MLTRPERPRQARAALSDFASNAPAGWRLLGEITQDIIAEMRFNRDVQALHRLGARVLYEYLAELGRDHMIRTAIEAKLERYLQLSPAMLKLTGGDGFAPSPVRAVGVPQ